MKASRLPAVWLCFWIAGCGGGCGGAIETDETATQPTVEPTVTPGGETTEPPEESEVDPGPPPVLRVAGEPDAHRSVVAIRIENRGTEPAELAGTITLERQVGQTWEPVDAQLDLRFSCDDEAPDCITLAPGGAYLPPEWLGTTGAAQCACEACGRSPAGTYRFVARSCNGAHIIEGEPFAHRSE